jgi:hypothetical protein
MPVDFTAEALLSTAEEFAADRGQSLSGLHVLCCAFRHPFPGLAKVLAQAELSAGTLVEGLESLLAIGVYEAPAQPFRDIFKVAEAGSTRQELTPRDVLVAALREDGKGTRAFRTLLREVEQGLLEQLELLAGSHDNVDTNLRVDRIGSRGSAIGPACWPRACLRSAATTVSRRHWAAAPT